VVEVARWAVDLIDQYDRYLLALGEPAQQVLSATHVAGKAKARAALAAFDAVDVPQQKVEVKFVGGPWAGQTTTVERVVGPVFAVGHEVGNHYWLDSKSKGTPLYYWDGTS
jgi:hypothetical protein